MVEDLTEEVQTLNIQKEEVVNRQMLVSFSVPRELFPLTGCEDCPAHGAGELEEVPSDYSR